MPLVTQTFTGLTIRPVSTQIWFLSSGTAISPTWEFDDRLGGPEDRHFAGFIVRQNGSVELSIYGDTASFRGAGHDLVDDFEREGSILISVAVGDQTASLLLNGITETPPVDEPYAWSPANSAEVIAFARNPIARNAGGTASITFSLRIPDVEFFGTANSGGESMTGKLTIESVFQGDAEVGGESMSGVLAIGEPLNISGSAEVGGETIQGTIEILPPLSLEGKIETGGSSLSGLLSVITVVRLRGAAEVGGEVLSGELLGDLELVGDIDAGAVAMTGRLSFVGFAPFAINQIGLFDNVNLLMDQWARTVNFRRLMDLRQDYLDNQALAALQHIEKQRNIYTAYGIGLDHFGEKVNLGRPFYNIPAFAVFGWGPDDVGFNQGPFAGPGQQHLEEVSLSDEYYRALLIIRAGMLVSDGSLEYFVATLRRGLAVADGSVAVDVARKSVTVTFTGIPAQLFTVIQSSNVIEAPPGVALTLQSA